MNRYDYILICIAFLIWATLTLTTITIRQNKELMRKLDTITIQLEEQSE